MKEKWRQTTAIFLACIFLFLSVAVEFYHPHNAFQSGQPTLTKSEYDVDDVKRNQNHSFVCLACLYGLTQLAPALSFQTIKPNQRSLFTILRESTCYLIILPTPYYLRAPPAEIT